MHLRIKILLVLLIGLAFALPSRAGQEHINVAAASDLKFALEEIAASFQRETGKHVSLSFGSSGTFTTQIRHGAPFQLFLSADESNVFLLQKQGLTLDEGALYAFGRIAIIAPRAAALEVDSELKGLAVAIEADRLNRFAIANPEHAPYGQRAQEALQHAGLWQSIRPELIYGENVSQAAQFAMSGSADGGIVALSLAISPQISSQIKYALIPEEWHTPLKQRMVLLKNAGAVAKLFYAYLQQPAARAVFERYGFTLPEESR